MGSELGSTAALVSLMGVPGQPEPEALVRLWLLGLRSDLLAGQPRGYAQHPEAVQDPADPSPCPDGLHRPLRSLARPPGRVRLEVGCDR